jgi:hypothetical protein
LLKSGCKKGRLFDQRQLQQVFCCNSFKDTSFFCTNALLNRA